ncbi:MAG: adenylate/guanylate cyclase domain-containing protein [Leptospiraceae bacterium]|nr:adenylate/guanylate cyclase domain-containing protein [Leptospiraceae bacterium]
MAETSSFQVSKFNIRVKLMLIISGIIFVSLFLIIELATHFFRRDSEIRVKENDLQISNLVSLKIQSEFLARAKNMKLFASELESLKDCKSLPTNRIFFENEEEILYVGIFKKEGNSLKEVNSCLNPQILSKNFSDSEGYISAASTDKSLFFKSFDGSTILTNSSSTFSAAVIGYSFPYKEINNTKTILISFLKPSKSAETFRSNGINLVYMVDEKGIVLGHPEVSFVMQEKSFADLPVVKSMISAKQRNSQIHFEENGEKFIGTFQKLDFAPGAVISIIPEDKAFEEVYNIQKRNIFITIAILSFAILIVFIYSRSLTIPILQLVDSSNEISKGNYQIYNEPKSKDEVGVLTTSFNSMAKGLDEREKMKTAFRKFVNEEIAELSMKGEIKLGGERKFCAIFFSDIRSFTSISEKLEPEEVVEFLNQYMTEMVRCVRETGGIVDKFIGDAIMATWGALKPLKNETEAAINASLLMREALLKFNIGRGSTKKPIIQIGCGINSGYVISGQIGSDERLEYTVIGDAVNLASRVESLNKPFGTDLLITQDSYDKVSKIFRVEKMPSIKVKGKEEPQTIYAVLGRLDDKDCPKTLKELREKVGIHFEEEAEDDSKKKPKKKANLEKEEKYEIL